MNSLLPKTTTEDYILQDIGDIIAMIKDPPKTLPLLYYLDRKRCDQPDCAYLQQTKAQP